MSANFVWEKKRGWLCILYMVSVGALVCMHMITRICLSIKEEFLNNYCVVYNSEENLGTLNVWLAIWI